MQRKGECENTDNADTCSGRNYECRLHTIEGTAGKSFVCAKELHCKTHNPDSLECTECDDLYTQDPNDNRRCIMDVGTSHCPGVSKVSPTGQAKCVECDEHYFPTEDFKCEKCADECTGQCVDKATTCNVNFLTCSKKSEEWALRILQPRRRVSLLHPARQYAIRPQEREVPKDLLQLLR